MGIDSVAPQIEDILKLEGRDGRLDSWLWEHTQRVRAAALAIARWSEVATLPLDLLALEVAALYHDAGWAIQYRQGRMEPWEVLAKPTNDLQRELAAGLLEEQAGPLLPAAVTRRASEAVRMNGKRRSDSHEALILAEADILEDFGVAGFFRLARTYLGQGRPLGQLILLWERQQEYNYWTLRLNELHFERSRAIAAARLPRIAEFIDRMRTEFSQADLNGSLAV